MKKYILFVIIASSVLTGLAAYGQEDRTPRLGNFDGVSIQVPAQTVIVRGRESGLDMDMSESTARKVDIFNDRGTLVIKPRGGAWLRRSDAIRIRITMPEWHSLSVSASGSLRSEDSWTSDDVKIRSTGSCDIFLNSLTVRSAELSLSGSGNVSMNRIDAGQTLSAHSTGSGNILIQETDASTMEIRLTGSGDLNGSVEAGQLEARLSGSGNVRISGHTGSADLQTTGSGDIDGDRLMADEAVIKITGSGNVSLSDGSRIKEIRMTGSGVFRSR